MNLPAVHSKFSISTAKTTDTNNSLRRTHRLSKEPSVRQFQARELVKTESSLTLQEQIIVEKTLV